MAVPPVIPQLIQRFRDNLSDYRSGQYNETQLRREFLDPFFEALGWDVNNTQGYAEAYKDVVHEDAVKVEGAKKAPDYGFRIGGTRKFFVEAKKPSVRVKDEIPPAFQLRRYAWSAKLPLSILTDFEEFAVYDCRVKPDKFDKASTARVMYFAFEQYVDKWEEIANVFSREAVLKGSFDRYAEAATGKRGTQEVDDVFLAEIERWRELLARNIALRNPGLSVRDLNYAVQLTIDRLVFLRIAEDRGFEEYERLRKIAAGKDVYAQLLEVFRRADARYNSGLFHFRAEKGRENVDTLTPRLVIDDKTFKDILSNLYYPDSPYSFNAMPADILGQVYEQFLGKVIRLTKGGRAEVEDKPEVKKTGGVYYTPTYIVEYIVQHTVGKLVEEKTPEEVSALKICDPACGSGSFLLGAFQFLVDWHLTWYLADDAKKWAKPDQRRAIPHPTVYETIGRGWRLTTVEKRRILVNNLFGVDIDPQAVEVTKLSLLLKVLEDVSQLNLFDERVLPDLNDNIKCGNSLIGPDFYQAARFAGQMIMFDREESYRINAFDWEAEFPTVFRNGVAGGFDAVIGNPPYGALLSKSEVLYLSNIHKLQNYQYDTYLLFIEKSLTLLKKFGLIGNIIPNTWLSNLTATEIRKHFFYQTQLEIIVHYQYHVFRSAKVDTEIVIIRKQIPGNEHQIQIEVIDKARKQSAYKIPQTKWQAGNGQPVNLFERPEFTSISDKLRALKTLNELCVITQGCKPFQVGKGKPPQTQKIVDEKPFVSERQLDKTFRPLLRGSLINRYKILWEHNYYISLGDWLAEPRYSASYEASEKLVIRQTGYYLIATLDTEQFVARDNLYTIVPRENNIELKYVLGLINSRLLQWFYSTNINPELGEALAQVKRGHLAQLPIRPINFSDPTDVARHDRMVALVQSMLDLHKQLTAAHTPTEKTLIQRQIAATDKAIDQLVYQLYGLTEDEVGIVEG